jgi:hypothetical protein
MLVVAEAEEVTVPQEQTAQAVLVAEVMEEILVQLVQLILAVVLVQDDLL